MKTGYHLLKALCTTISILLIIPCAMIAQNIGQWEYVHPDYPAENLRSVNFADNENVWAVGDNGVLVHSTDGGFNWNFQDLGIRKNFNNIQFVDSEKGWIVGHDGLILHTNNGGEQWVIQNTDTDRDLFAVNFLDENIGWAAGRSSTILRTNNGGLNWVEVDHPYSGGRLDNIQFINEEFGMTVGTKSTQEQVYMLTTDGGETWEESSIGSPSRFNDLHIFDENNIIISSGNGQIRTTSDGGENWISRTITSTSSNLYSIHFIDENNGWVAGSIDAEGNTPVLFTDDGGESWTSISSEYRGNFRSIYVLEDGYFVGVGLSGLISTTLDNGITVQNLPDEPIRDLYSIVFTDSENGWIAGGGGTLLNTTDGGVNWEMIKRTDQDRFDDIFFADEMNGWIAGSNGQIRKTTDGGQNWEIIETDATANLHSITFTDPDNGWASGASGTLLKTNDAGESWMEVDSGVSFLLESVEFVDENTGFIAGGSFSDGGQILKTTDAGDTWEVIRTVDGRIIDMYFINETLGFAVGQGGTILRTENGGENWIGRQSNTNSALNSVYFSDPDNGWAAGFQGETIFTNDGGDTWRVFSGVNGLTLNALYIDDTNKTWTVGHNGTIMQFNTSDSPPAVNLLYPADQSTDVPVGLDFVWGISNGASSYDLQVATDQDFNSMIVDETELSSATYTPEDNLGSEELYFWRVRSDQFGVKSDWSDVFSFTTELTTSVSEDTDLPRKFTLKQNYPNPFNPTTTIEFTLPHTSDIKLEVFNIVGQRVATLANETRQAGVHQISLDASEFASGVYFYRLNTGSKVLTKSMTLIK